MSRIARITIPDFPHHVVQRGNNRKKIFFYDSDKKVYLNLVENFSKKWICDILAYCLMPNHVHFLIVPQRENSLAKMMQGLSLTYTQFFNKKYKRTGRLWECRFYSSIVNRDGYIYNLIRYIYANPVRANLVNRPEDYPWSSASWHVFDNKKDWFVKNLDYIKKKFGLFDELDFGEYLKESLDLKTCQDFYKSTIQGKPIGNNSFVKNVEERFKIKFPNS